MRSFLFISITLFFISCNTENPTRSLLPKVTGSYSKVLVVHDNNQRSSDFKKATQSILSKEVSGILQRESEFEVITVEAKSFSNLLKRQRQVLLFSISPQHQEATFSIVNDAFAKGQKYVQIKAKNKSDAMLVFKQKSQLIYDAFNENRRTALQKKLITNSNKGLMQKLKNTQAISMIIPRDFKLDKDTFDFTYLFSKEKKPCEVGRNNFCYIQNGIMIYSFPYTSTGVFDAQILAAKRDSLTRMYIKGATTTIGEETYMRIESKFPISAGAIARNKEFAFQMKGWWTKENGIMGGPFVNLSFVDQERNRVICVDAFSFAPNFTKRDIVKELEAICWSAIPM